MNPKLKLTLLVISAAFLSALVTLFFQMTWRYHSYPMPLLGMGNGMMYQERVFDGGMMGADVSAGSNMGIGMMEKAPTEVSQVLPQTDTLSTNDKISVESSYYPGPYYGRDDALDVDERSIEMHSSRSVVVNDVSGYLQRNKDFITSVNGKVLSFNEGVQSGQGMFRRSTSYGYIDARVPADKFDEVNQQLGQNIKKVVFQSVNSQDITGQVVSIDESLNKLKDDLAEAQIVLDEAETDAAKQRAQIEIDRLERQIESMEQSQQNVDQRVAYATISVSAADNEEYFTPTWRTSWMDVMMSIFGSFFGFAYIVGALVIWTVLYSIVWLPIMLGLRFVRRSFAKKK